MSSRETRRKKGLEYEKFKTRMEAKVEKNPVIADKLKLLKQAFQGLNPEIERREEVRR